MRVASSPRGCRSKCRVVKVSHLLMAISIGLSTVLYCWRHYLEDSTSTSLLLSPASLGKTPNTSTQIQSTTSTTTTADLDQWFDQEFRAADPTEQEWCQHVWQHGTYWKSAQGNKGAQFSQDVFIARRLFSDYIRQGRPGIFVEAGANHYQELSSSYFLEKCLGWDGLCVEPQRQYHADFAAHRSCRLVPECLAAEPSDMMLGGMPAFRGAGMYVQPIPANDEIPSNFERIHCSPLHLMVSTQHVDVLILDVEGAEVTVLDVIHWDKMTFGALLVETNKMKAPVKTKLVADMAARGYQVLHELRIDTLFVPSSRVAELRQTNQEAIWKPPGNILGLTK